MRYASGPYWQGQLLKNIEEVEVALTNRWLRDGDVDDAVEQKDWRYRVEDVSFGRNTVMYGLDGAGITAGGKPAVMVRFPAVTQVSLVAGWPSQVHPAFVVGGANKAEIWIGKYLSAWAGAAKADGVVSLRGLDPGHTRDWGDTHDSHKNMGGGTDEGFHLMTQPENALLALLCKAEGFWPRGNNNYGADIGVSSEKGTPTHHYSATQIGRTATGSGPLAWYHDGTPFGVADVNGNVWEWAGGMMLWEGRILLLENNNGADNTVSQADPPDPAADSWGNWKAIDADDGAVVTPVYAATDQCFYDSDAVSDGDGDRGDAEIDTSVTVPLSTGYMYNTFQAITYNATNVTVAALDTLRKYGLYPVDADHAGDGFWARNAGSRRPRVRANFGCGSWAGVCSLFLIDAASNLYWTFGGRLAYVKI